MKLTVIGYWGGYPGKGEATSGYLLQHDGYNVLIDCGSGVLSGRCGSESDRSWL